jgi:hypothetical protein
MTESKKEGGLARVRWRGFACEARGAEKEDRVQKKNGAKNLSNKMCFQFDFFENGLFGVWCLVFGVWCD